METAKLKKSAQLTRRSLMDGKHGKEQITNDEIQ
jgi:hypothetical protein